MRSVLIISAMLLSANVLFGQATTNLQCEYGNRQETLEIKQAVEGYPLTKRGEMDGNRYILHLNKVGSYDKVADFIEFIDKEDRSVTYSLNCQ